jgi:hypothetical protein
MLATLVVQKHSTLYAVPCESIMRSFPLITLRVIGAFAGLIAVLSASRAHSELITPPTLEKLYSKEVIVRDLKDPVLTAYWPDKAGEIDFQKSSTEPPVISIGRFTDAIGRELVVTTLDAPYPVCNFNGCPVRILTARSEKLLDTLVCNLASEHYLSVDRRAFIGCDEEFAIPGSGRVIRGASVADAELPTEYHLYGIQHDFKDLKDSVFTTYWGNLSGDIAWETSPTYRTIHVGHFVDADGRKLVVTTFHDPVECGMKVCPIRIFDERGDILLDSIACNVPELHRISTDRRYLIACRQTFKIPESATPDARTAAATTPPSPGRRSQLQLEKIPYDAGAELDSPKSAQFQEYWGDKISRINWKAPISKRGMIYNWPLPSADGRLLTLTMLESAPGGVCNPLCPVRVFTAKHTKIMDILACDDRTRHGVSIDHRSFIACGEVFPIPQVDELAAIRENAPGDSDPDAYVEVVRRARTQPANAPKPVFVDSAFHNRSQMLVSEWKDGTVEITYDGPRPGLPVAQGTLLFRGARDGARYSGTAYTFKAGCQPAAYPVTGMRDQKRELLILTGPAPHRDPHSCEVVRQSVQSGHAKLVFDLRYPADF